MDTAKGQLFVVAAPSGGGKTSLIKAVIQALDKVVVSVSYTTRAMRPGEIPEKDYFFVDDRTFARMLKAEEFLESAQVFNHQYGTSLVQINSNLVSGLDVILDIDWQGAQQIRAAFPDASTIFVMPPSLSVLEQRLLDRNQDKPEVIKHRMMEAQREMSHYPEFDYLIINDDFALAAEELKSIITANRLKINRKVRQHKKLLSLLLAEE